MRLIQPATRALLVLLTLAMAVPATHAAAHQAQPESQPKPESQPAKLGKLGTVHFPTSTRSDEAQARFLRGVAALHSFWYPVALDEFRAATKIDPDFMMGYWGEAMTYNHPLWSDPQETEAARKAIEKIRHRPELMPHEQAYLHAVKVLYGEGDKPARDDAYAAAMEKIHLRYPDDLEAATFYALSLLGSVRPEDPTALRTRMRAGAIAWDVYRRAPDHPGAAHYILHAFDDPDHAILALPAARHYAQIAPASHHAQHMPLHIFLQLGMWTDAAASNEAAWKTSDDWVKRNNLPISQRDYHALHWLLYVYLQQGRYRDAQELLTIMQKSLPEFPTDDPRMLAYGAYTQAGMAAALVVETERWNDADRLLPVPHVNVQDSKTSAAHDPSQAYAALTQIPAIFARGLAAAMTGAPEAHDSVAALRTIREQSTGAQEPFVGPILKMSEIQELEIAAAAAASKGDLEKASTIMQRATALQDAAPPSPGPPTVIKPSHELYGEILLRAGRPAEAAQQFEKSLFQHPNRARSLLGAARAAAQTGQTQDAANAYAQLSQQWQGDTQVPELREAEQYLKQAGARQEAAK